MIREVLRRVLYEALPKEALPKQVVVGDNLSEEGVQLEHPANLSHGDYSSNVALELFSRYSTLGLHFSTPLDLARAIVGRVEKPDFLEKVEVAGPGFINLWLTQDWLLREAFRLAQEPVTEISRYLGFSPEEKSVVIDYSSPNIARRFSVGHLRSTVIGQALYNLYAACGWRTVGDNHLGDWGTQFGKLIYAVRRWSSLEEIARAEDKIGRLQELYVRFHKEAKKDPQLVELGREWFRKLEEGDPQARSIWKQIVEWSLSEFERIYELLEVKIDFAFGESFYQEWVAKVVREAKERGLARYSEGAWVVDVGKDIPPGILVKSDGTTTYFTRDLAAVKFRLEKWDPELIVYEVGKEQRLHFKQLFRAVEKFGWKKDLRLVHVAHGHLRLPEGAMSTREGRVVLMEEVLLQAIAKARSFLKVPDEKLAREIGIGAVKYNDLKQQVQKDILFEWEKILSFEGNSGPYLQYTHARARSVLRRAKDSGLELVGSGKKWGLSIFREKVNTLNLSKEEEQILRTLYRFPEVVADAAGEFAPNKLCDFLFDLAQKYNTFYQKQRIIGTSWEKMQLRLVLTAATAKVLKTGLALLGIAAPERM